MSEYEHSQSIDAPPDEVFRFVSEVGNLPRYLPTTHAAQRQDGDRVRVQGEAQGHDYDADGYFRVDEAARRLEWGADEPRRYGGWLTVGKGGAGGASQVTVHLSFGPAMAPPPDAGRDGAPDDADIQEGLEASIRSIEQIVTGRGGKVEPAAAT